MPYGLLAALWLAAVPQEADVQSAAEAVQSFLEALRDGQAQLLTDLGTDPFSFEGRQVAGRGAIHKFWSQLLAAGRQQLRHLRDARVEVFDHRTALEKFGPPPAKFSPLPLRRCLFAAVTFHRRNGFLLILKKENNAWRVAAVTD